MTNAKNDDGTTESSQARNVGQVRETKTRRQRDDCADVFLVGTRGVSQWEDPRVRRRVNNKVALGKKERENVFVERGGGRKEDDEKQQQKRRRGSCEKRRDGNAKRRKRRRRRKGLD